MVVPSANGHLMHMFIWRSSRIVQRRIISTPIASLNKVKVGMHVTCYSLQSLTRRNLMVSLAVHVGLWKELVHRSAETSSAPPHFFLLLLLFTLLLSSVPLTPRHISPSFFWHVLLRAVWASNSWTLCCDEVWCPDPHNRAFGVWRLHQFMKRNLHIWSPGGDAPLLHWQPHYPDRVLWNTDSKCPKRKLCSYFAFFLWSRNAPRHTHILFSIPPQ